MIDLFTQGFILNALLVSIVMGLLLAYLGVHVVARGIVFVDLALGQISMLGVAVAAYLEIDATSTAIVFTMVGAFILSFINVKDPRLKQEAIIGIIYAFASAVTVLLISKSAHGESDISEVLFGSLFTVTESSLISMAVVFAIIGIVHFVFRRQFFELTDRFTSHGPNEGAGRGHDIANDRTGHGHDVAHDHEGDTSAVADGFADRGPRARFDARSGIFDVWNFLFYLSVGLAIVLAVRAGGVIPVFAFIVVPPVAAILLTRGRAAVVALSLIISVVGSFFGLYFSVTFDFPAGSSIVAILGVLFMVAAAVRGLRGSKSQANEQL